MGDYYYLVAQLPSISFGLPPPLDSKSLLSLCSSLMSKADAELLESCVLSPAPRAEATGSPCIDGWNLWEFSLERELARLRASKMKRDGFSLPEAGEALEAAAVARAAFQESSPLEAELVLLKARWDKIENLAGLSYFGRDSVYAFILKVLLLERKSLFRLEEGFAEYKSIYASVREAAPKSILSGEPK